MAQPCRPPHHLCLCICSVNFLLVIALPRSSFRRARSAFSPTNARTKRQFASQQRALCKIFVKCFPRQKWDGNGDHVRDFYLQKIVLSHSFVHAFNQSINQSIIQSLNHAITQSFNHSIIQSFNQSFIHSFTHALGGGQGRARARGGGAPPPSLSPDPSSSFPLCIMSCVRARAPSRFVPPASLRAREPPLRPSSQHHQHHCARVGTNSRPSGTPPDLRNHRLAPACA